MSIASDWFGCVLVISFYVVKVFSELLAISTSYEVHDTGRGTRKVITNLNRSLGSRNFLYVMNERTGFALWASAFKSYRLIIGLIWTSHQKVAYHFFVTFEWNNQSGSQQGSSQDQYEQSGPKHCKWGVKTPTGWRQAAVGHIQRTAKELNSRNHWRTIQLVAGWRACFQDHQTTNLASLPLGHPASTIPDGKSLAW